MKQIKIGMTCRKHRACDVVNPKEGVALCTAQHNYEIWDKNHKYDLVFFTSNSEWVWDLKDD